MSLSPQLRQHFLCLSFLQTLMTEMQNLVQTELISIFLISTALFSMLLVFSPQSCSSSTAYHIFWHFHHLDSYNFLFFYPTSITSFMLSFGKRRKNKKFEESFTVMCISNEGKTLLKVLSNLNDHVILFGFSQLSGLFDLGWGCFTGYMGVTRHINNFVPDLLQKPFGN